MSKPYKVIPHPTNPNRFTIEYTNNQGETWTWGSYPTREAAHKDQCSPSDENMWER